MPTPAALDQAVSAFGETSFDAIAVLTDHFYPILAELHALTRDWERTAKEGAIAGNKLVAELWNEARANVEGRGGQVTDAYGRELRLHHLPSDLLSLTEPRQVVVVGTRLPEDFDNWAEWVRKEKP